jgi:hypothetical protein
MSKTKSAMEKQAEKQIEKQKLKLPAATYDNPYLEAAAEAGNPFGKLLKFVKGKWEIGDDEVPLGTEYIAHIDQLARGWVRFEDGKVTDFKIEKVAGGIKLPTRDELPDNDPKKWTEKDADDNPRDPWCKQWYLPLIGVDTNDFATFVSGSNGGNNAIANLCRVYGHNMRDGRPLNDPAALERARTELRQGTGIVKVAKQVGLGVGTVHRLALELRSQPPV